MRLIFNNAFASNTGVITTVGPPAVSISGNVVQVTQPYSVVPIEIIFDPPGPPIGYSMCQREMIDLSSLPPGNYTLRWTYTFTGPPDPPPTVSLPFSVPAPTIPTLGSGELVTLAVVLAVIGIMAIRR